jgi:hypothetical protein
MAIRQILEHTGHACALGDTDRVRVAVLTMISSPMKVL